MANPRYWPKRHARRIANPGANTEISIISTTGGLWIVRSLVATFTADATVANRTVVFTADDGTTEYFRTRSESVIAASGLATFAAFDGSSSGAEVGDVVHLAWPTDGLVLPPGHRLRTSTVNLQSGDAFTNVALMVDDWPLGPEHRFRPVPGFIVEEV